MRADETVEPATRFPHFQSEPVSYLQVKMQDAFWAPRQKIIHEVSVAWVTRRHDPAGGLEAFKKCPQEYRTQTRPSEMEHIKFIEAMATVVGVEHDPAIIGLIDAWVQPLIEGQSTDGYLGQHFPPGENHPPHRWQAVCWSHEDYTIGHYLEAAIAYREVTGNEAMFRSAVRAADNMAAALLDGHHAYTSGHPEIEQALMRLYAVTGAPKYLRLCGWLLDQRGCHEGRRGYGRARQDHLPVKDQRTIEGHAVMAAYLFNGATEYVGATGDAAYREAVVAAWDDLVNHKLYWHGAGGCKSARNEGYLREPYWIRPDDAYGESCSVVANFQWAHNLFRLSGEARYLDTAERMLYNAFYASLSLEGDSSFYSNVAQTGLPIAGGSADDWLRYSPASRSPELATSCCPPNIVKLFSKVAGFFYSTDKDGVYVKHYGASQANIPWDDGLQLIQRTAYPWDGAIAVLVKPRNPGIFTLRLRLPAWATSYSLSVNHETMDITPQQGWLAIRRHWSDGDQVDLVLPMEIRRITMPADFRDYENRAALQRGPIVYCLEEQDLENPARQSINAIPVSVLNTLYIPQDARFIAVHDPDLLGGVTVLRGQVRQVSAEGSDASLSAMFVPYGVWGNRLPGSMRIWLGARPAPWMEFFSSQSGLMDDRDG